MANASLAEARLPTNSKLPTSPVCAKEHSVGKLSPSAWMASPRSSCGTRASCRIADPAVPSPKSQAVPGFIRTTIRFRFAANVTQAK